MARRAKPWFRKARGAWFVTVEGVQHNLGADKKEAFERFYQLMRQPQRRVVSSQALVAGFGCIPRLGEDQPLRRYF